MKSRKVAKKAIGKVRKAAGIVRHTMDHAKLARSAMREFAAKRTAQGRSQVKSASDRFKAHPFVKAKARRALVKGTKANTRSNFPLARKGRGDSKVMRSAAANEIRRSRAISKAKGRASAGHVGIAKLSHKGHAIPHTTNLKGRKASLFRVSRHGGKTATRFLGRTTL